MGGMRSAAGDRSGMAIYWQEDACRRAGLTDVDLVALSGEPTTAEVVQAWLDNLYKPPAAAGTQQHVDHYVALARRMGY
jgi:hypothetical protein